MEDKSLRNLSNFFLSVDCSHVNKQTFTVHTIGQFLRHFIAAPIGTNSLMAESAHAVTATEEEHVN